MAKIGRLNVEVGATNNTRKGLAAASTDISKWAQKTEKFGGGRARAIASVVAGPAGMAVAALTTAGLAAAAAIGATGIATAIAIKKGAGQVDALADASKRLLGNAGATGALAGMHLAAKQYGIEADSINDGLKDMMDNLSKAANGDTGLSDMLKSIGIDAKEINRLRPEERFYKLADAIGGLGDVGDKIRVGKTIFGESGAMMVDMFNNGSAAIRAATGEVALYGQAISAIDAKKVDVMEYDIDRLKMAWEGVTMQLAVQFAPLISDISGRLLGVIENTGGVGKAVETAFTYGVGAVGLLLDEVEALELGWVRASKGVNDFYLNLYKVDPDSNLNKIQINRVTEERLQGIPEHRREAARALLEKQGGFESESPNVAAFKEQQRLEEEYQKRVAEIAERKANKGTLGDRFEAWVQNSQVKGATDAAAKLANISEKRLDAEEKITKELRAQKGIQEAGQGRLALTWLGGWSENSKPQATAASSEGEEKAGPTTLAKAVETTRADAPKTATSSGAMATPAKSNWGTKEFWDQTLFGVTPEKETWRDKIPTGEPKWASKIPAGEPGYMSKIPQGPPKYASKVPDAMADAVAGGAGGKMRASFADMSATNNLLREIHGTLQGGVAARYA